MEYAGVKILKIGLHLVKIWIKICGLLFWTTLYIHCQKF